MKKLLVMATVLVAGVVSAKENPIKEKETKTVSNFITQKKSVHVVMILEKQNWFAETSCGVTAITVQDWTPQQASEWLDKLEAYYCKPGSHSGPSTNLAGN